MALTLRVPALRLTLLLGLGACDEGAPAAKPANAPADSGPAPAGDGGTPDDPVPVDQDGDGAPEAEDCDDADPDRYPGAPERCDGLDQDCDEDVDEGIPTDGDGCRDPGPPAFPEAVGVIHVGVRTGGGATDGSGSPVLACLGPDRCFGLNKPGWIDLQPGMLDIQVAEGRGWSRSDLSGLSLSLSATADDWAPTCVEVRLDGEPVSCRLTPDLRLGGASGAASAWIDPEGWGHDCSTCAPAALTHGPMVGALGPDRALLWVRADATRAVKLRVAEGPEGLEGAAPVTTRYPTAEDDFTASLPVFGLQPDTTFHYSIEVDGVVHGPFRFRTPPAEGAPTQLRLAFGSCARVSEQPIFAAIAAADPALMVFLGDAHYGDVTELAAQRQFYRWALDRTDRAAALAQRSTLAIWDDHDYAANDADGATPTKDVSLRVFGEYWANGPTGTEALAGAFSHHRWGDVELFLLDGRYWRGLDGTLLGEAQTDWLFEGLRASTATFKLVASGSQWTTHGSSESWRDHADEAEALRQRIVEDSIEGVILLSGDAHRSELRSLAPAPGGYPIPELTGSPLANTARACPTDPEELLACGSEPALFTLLDIDTTLADPTVEVSVINALGEVRATQTWAASALRLSPAGPPPG